MAQRVAVPFAKVAKVQFSRRVLDESPVLATSEFRSCSSSGVKSAKEDNSMQQLSDELMPRRVSELL